MKPLIVINFKTYESATGDKALELAKIIAGFSNKAEMIVCPQFADLKTIADSVDIPVFAQHIDDITPGKGTGHILPESVKAAGCSGTLINHSERRLDIKTIKGCVNRAKELRLRTICCSPDIGEVKKISAFEPDYIAFEDPELIGTLKSVSKLEPETVRNFAEVINKTKSLPLCGAGVANGKDVKAAIDLGTNGVLIATAVTKAEDPRAVLENLISLI